MIRYAVTVDALCERSEQKRINLYTKNMGFLLVLLAEGINTPNKSNRWQYISTIDLP